LAPELKKIGSGATTSTRATPAKQVHFRACNALKTSLFSGVQRPQNKFIFRIVLRALGARTKKIGSSATTSARKYFGRKYFRSCNARKTAHKQFRFEGAWRPN